MYYHAYYNVDVVNGPGTRCTLFVSGCEHRCAGCYNSATWPVDSGRPFSLAMEKKIIADLQDTRIRRQGFSLSGGDPLHPANLATVQALVEKIKHYCPEKDIWCWTGYSLAALSQAQRKVLRYLDVLIDGPFIKEKKQSKNPWYGSSNQRLIPCKALNLG